MKKIVSFLMVFALIFTMSACTKEPYEQISITASELQEKLDNKEDFVLLIERDGCAFCKKLNKYIKQTKEEHYNVTLYVLDITGYELEQDPNDETKFTSESEEGKILLNLAPYFRYTPALYVVKDGEATKEALGFDDDHKTVAMWDTDSAIDFETADADEFWDFVEDNQ